MPIAHISLRVLQIAPLFAKLIPHGLIYNPQNEMFATFQTKRYFIQNETSSKK